MFEKFCDYMYYLLTSPFKKIKKSKNQWYKLFKILGEYFDDGMESIEKAREQTMIATCDVDMLPVHAADRKLTKYTGEEDENFRCRIANYTEVCRLGGTDGGVLLAVRLLGFDNVQLVAAKIYTGDETRWAEFYILLYFDIDDAPDISLGILRKQVRKVKEVGAKDNYSYQYQMAIQNCEEISIVAIQYSIRLMYYPYLALDGSWKLDGSKKLNSRRKQYPVLSTYKPKITTQEQISRVICHEEHNLFFLDGSWKLDGSKRLSAWQRMEEL